MSLERLPNVNSTPTFFLHKLLEDVDQIEAVCAVVKWKGGTFQLCWSAQALSDMAMCLSVVLHDIPDVIKGRPGDEAPQRPGAS